MLHSAGGSALLQPAVEAASLVLPWLPDLSLFVDVVMANLGMFDFIFLAIVLFQAWKIPAPFRVRLGAPSA